MAKDNEKIQTPEELDKLPNIIDTKTLCEHMGVTRQAVYKWRKQGMPTKIWKNNGTIRYDLEDVLLWLNENEATGPQGN